MAEPIIVCPNCKSEIKLTRDTTHRAKPDVLAANGGARRDESRQGLAAPLIESKRREYERQIAQKEAEVRQAASLKTGLAVGTRPI